ncbi:helix-turn-helix protein [Actinocorallia herbida]|uniref:Helix-turn-helix protein n=1 Tax=Actinocorallia herbida TaxID=58109 RepID=A0A3N1DCT0_9ACTN|nr:helix-turn-helix transcriptional regulator [Actinocorallia herbida]ROO91332.1 helix-turn-helix protein [Actinocorallia herbida]
MTAVGGSETSGLQRAFADELTARREAADMSRAKLAEVLGCTRQWLDKVETLKSSASSALADDLDTYFATGGSFRRLWNRFDDARKQGLIPRGYRPIIDAEQSANRISVFEPVVITGLMQTEDLARLMHQSAERPEQTDELVAIRMERQRLLDRPDAPWFTLVMREAVLRDLPKALKEQQCKHLLDRLENPKISIQIVPREEPAFTAAGFHLLSFEDEPDVAYLDAAGGHGQIVSDFREVGLLAVLFNRIRATALSARESARLIHLISEGK